MAFFDPSIFMGNFTFINNFWPFFFFVCFFVCLFLFFVLFIWFFLIFIFYLFFFRGGGGWLSLFEIMEFQMQNRSKNAQHYYVTII